LTKAERDELNGPAGGWSSPLGLRYLAAKDGKIDAESATMFREAARLDAADLDDSAERIWLTMQNDAIGWSELPYIECSTDFPRSMDVGDLIVWEDGTVERCASYGFERVATADEVVLRREFEAREAPGGLALTCDGLHAAESAVAEDRASILADGLDDLRADAIGNGGYFVDPRDYPDYQRR
jgi:hypothetical protein